jgi:hypothetical protein
MAGAYRLRSAEGAAVVGYHGSFWVAEGQVDPVRINVIADEIPTDIGFSAATSVLDYGPITIGGRTSILPQAAEIVFADTEGTEHRSRLNFRACHEFVGESVVKFNVAKPESTVALPEDFTVDIDLITPIDSDTSAGGDPIQAVLVDDMKLNDGNLVPKGATVSGRIAHITKNGASYLLDFVVTSIVFEGAHVELSGRQNSISVENWSKIRQSGRLNLQRGTHLRLQSIKGKSGK